MQIPKKRGLLTQNIHIQLTDYQIQMKNPLFIMASFQAPEDRNRN